ncbi:mannonate dehydratase [Jannaschia sp. M317]|uniref:mannonate dehydratase n=1 Tax=Jannaschia sp. M317 TaxID=2867011 RepID=UPI0021A5A2C7|nr:mannonate dehydratase [Jannaschia sp. M317]UWQ16188.1 mannonate dehydratase [Jannaschia sp. M317]
MKATWRWFGPHDSVPVEWMEQAGARGVVSALHHIPPGTVWTDAEIAKRKQDIATRIDGAPSRLRWDVVESLPVSERIKTQTTGWRDHIDAYRHSLEAIARAGIKVVCYNFMPVLDWTRTDLAWRLDHGGTAMRFAAADFAAFDLHVLKRPAAVDDTPAPLRAAAAERIASMDDTAQARLAANLVMGLPGGQPGLTLDELRSHLATYDSISAEQLRRNLADFLAEVVPTAERLGLRLCCHPDDPPWPLLGLPRIVSTLDDYVALTDAVDSPANGVTLCSGSLGARADNDLPAMMRRLGCKVHFIHLRNTTREDGLGSFHEAEHLGGDTDMPALISEILAEETRRRAAGRTDAEIPFRPDHGQDILDDLTRQTQPGYPAIGRLKGLAELNGVIAGLTHALR